MYVQTSRRVIFTVAATLFGSAGLSAQAARPELTRGVPLELICGPQAALTAPSQAMKVTGGMEPAKSLFGTGDTLLINAGTAQGVKAGQHFYVRRVIKDRFTVKTTEAAPHSIHTAGWVTILEAKTDVSVARVSEACDGVLQGDYLEPLVLPPAATATPATEPDYSRPARVMLGDDRRQLGGEGTLMVIDRGSDHGLKPGQRLTIFRRTGEAADAPIVKLGDAVVASTQHETSMMRIEKVREPIQVGDLVAIHR